MARLSQTTAMIFAAALAVLAAAGRQAEAQPPAAGPSYSGSNPYGSGPRPLPPIVRPEDYYANESQRRTENLWQSPTTTKPPSQNSVEYVISDGKAGANEPPPRPSQPPANAPANATSSYVVPAEAGPPSAAPVGSDWRQPPPYQPAPGPRRVPADTALQSDWQPPSMRMGPPQPSFPPQQASAPPQAPLVASATPQQPLPRPPIDSQWLSEPTAPMSAGADEIRLPSMTPGAPKTNLFEPAQVVARVGDQPILAGDVLGAVNQALEPYKDKMSEEQYNERRRMLMKQYVDTLITTKLVYLDFLRTVPKEALPQIDRKVNEQFEAKQLPDLLKKSKVESAVELDAELRKFGESVAKRRRAFMEQALASQTIRKHVNMEPEVTHEQMLKYYRDHMEDYYTPAQAKWEHLMARFDQFPNEEAAFQAVAAMGNEVLGGAPLPAVARRSSQGPNASEGGQYDWTSKGSLKSKAVDEAIFSLPLGRLSQIIRDDRGFHIIRVVERRDEGHVPFEEAQVKIKDTIRQDLIRAETTAYIAKLRSQTKVWTIFEEEAAQAATAARPGADDRSPNSTWGS